MNNSRIGGEARLILTTTVGGEELVAAGHGGSPGMISVAPSLMNQEISAYQGELEDAAGCSVFVRRVISVTRSSLIFVAEILDEPLSSRYEWLNIADHRAALTDLILSAEEPSGVAGATLMEHFVNNNLRVRGIAWEQPGWYDRFWNASSRIGSEGRPHAYKLRPDSYAFRLRSPDKVYSVIAATGESQAIDERSVWLSHPAIRRHVPEGRTTWVDLDASVQVAPQGAPLSRLADLNAWNAATRSWAASQQEYAHDLRTPAEPILQAFMQRLTVAVDEWAAIATYVPGFGSAAVDWINQSVMASVERLQRLESPGTLINGGMSCHTSFLRSSDEVAEVAEWRPLYHGHPFMQIATIAYVRGGAFESVSSSRMAEAFVREWSHRISGDVGTAAQDGVVAGAAAMAIAAWESASGSPMDRVLAVGQTLAWWWQVIVQVGSQ